jgi:hypothetical protein
MSIVEDAPAEQAIELVPLPFRVRLVSSPQDLQRAVDIRAAAYSRHLPKLGAVLRTAEDEDYRSDVLVLIAERKFDGQVVGTLRLEPNVLRPLRVESETTLPPVLQGRKLVETSRLGVQNGSNGTMVTVALVKAAFEICRACEVDYTISVGRRSMAEVFRGLCFDVLEGPRLLSYSPTTPFWIFFASVRDWDARLKARSYAHFKFMSQRHPDISIDHRSVRRAFGVP